jgi:nitroreductase/NAD-dependent dihydropyrimidine dehydrogenase PreA subunit
MVLIDQTRCIACGQCVNVCHEGCMALADGVLCIDHDLCSTCTQCIALCPTLALSWEGIEPLPYESQQLPTPEQLDELFKQRRTVRRFKADPVDRALLQEVAAYGIYAPTNHYRLRALLIDDPQVLDELQAIGLRALQRVYNVFYRFKPLFTLLTRLTPAMQEKDKVKLEACLIDGRPFTVAPALIFIVGDASIAHAEASAQYALYNMVLYAQSKGLGSTISGGSRLLLNPSKAARRLLGLGKGERILATLYLGHPAVTFRNKVRGKEMPVMWVEAEG